MAWVMPHRLDGLLLEGQADACQSGSLPQTPPSAIWEAGQLVSCPVQVCFKMKVNGPPQYPQRASFCISLPIKQPLQN